MRLIDADKLYPDCMTKNGTLAISQSQIANALTVEERSYEQGVIDGRDTEFDNGFEQGYAKGYENCEHDNERPQGEWIRTGSLGNGNAHYECSNCHHGDEHAESQEVPYCWHCGASMKKGGAE